MNLSIFFTTLITKTTKYFLWLTKKTITVLTILPRYIIIGLKFILSKKPNNKELQKIEKNFIPIVILTLSIITYLISIFILTRWYVQNERTKNFTNNFSEKPITETAEKEEISNQSKNEIEESNETPSENIPPQNNNTTPTEPQTTIDTNFLNINLNYYTQKNPETVAWIQVNGTKVNYPIVQHNDNDFYLEHDFNQRKTKNGWIFGDYRNNFETLDNNTIIYGHNLINDTMFGTLPNLLNKNWFSNPNNHYIKLLTKNTNSVWQIFSVYKIKPTTDYLQTTFNSTTNYENFLKMLKNRSTYDFKLELKHTDKIITLSTCDDIGTKRVAIHAKLTKLENK